jgi:hypothetical protein
MRVGAGVEFGPGSLTGNSLELLEICCVGLPSWLVSDYAGRGWTHGLEPNRGNEVSRFGRQCPVPSQGMT